MLILIFDLDQTFGDLPNLCARPRVLTPKLIKSTNPASVLFRMINRSLVSRQISVVGRIDEVVREGPIHILRRHRLPFRVRARADDRVGRRVEVVHEVLEGKMRLHTRAVL